MEQIWKSVGEVQVEVRLIDLNEALRIAGVSKSSFHRDPSVLPHKVRGGKGQKLMFWQHEVYQHLLK